MRKLSEEIIKLGKSLKIEPQENGERITQTRKYKLITPLFGGGVSPRENDVSKLIRETSIRGQLRFWWRAMRGNGDLRKMKESEDASFGSADQNIGQSKILLSVKVNENHKIDNEGNSEQIFETKTRTVKTRDKDWSKLAYAAFPLQPDEGKQFYVRDDIEFTLSLSFPKSESAGIEDMLWAWETFGGIGGRIRRGFGAIQLLQINDEIEQEQTIERKKDEILEKFQRVRLINRSKFNVDIPHIGTKSSLAFQSARSVTQVWENSIESLKKFRQVRDKAFVGNRPHFSRNKWSEPDEIRRIFSRRYKHKKLKHQPIRSLGKFPRSEFGLPINFHFQQDEGIEKDFILQGAKSKKIERLSSPLIMRPIKCNNGAISIALILDAPRIPDDGLEIHYGKEFSEKVNSDKLTAIEAQELTSKGLTPLNYKTDVLQAFLDFFAKDEVDNRDRNDQKNNWRR